MSIMRTIVDELEKELDLKIEENYMEFVCNFYTEALAGTIIEWFKRPGSYDKESLLDYLLVIFKNAIPATLKRAAELKQLLFLGLFIFSVIIHY